MPIASNATTASANRERRGAGETGAAAADRASGGALAARNASAISRALA